MNRNPRYFPRIMSAGLLFVALGAVSLRYLQHATHLSPDLADGISGLCYGLGLGCLLLGISAKRRRDSAREAGGR